MSDAASLSAALLLGFAAVAICWVKSPWVDSYASLWSTIVDVRVGAHHFELARGSFPSIGYATPPLE